MGVAHTAVGGACVEYWANSFIVGVMRDGILRDRKKGLKQCEKPKKASKKVINFY
jgi:hypothetical protein